MAMSKGIRVGTITIGCSLFVLTFISMICGIVAMSKMSTPIAVSIGLWGLYFAIPGVFSVLAGYKKQSSLLAVALGTHVLGIVVAIVGMSTGAAFWAVLQASNCGHSRSYDIYGRSYDINCSDLKTVREATGAVTIIFALYAIVTFVGSIYGCIGTCGARRGPTTVIVTTGQQPNTILITATQGHSASNQQPPPNTVVMTTQAYPAYSQVSQQPPPYDPPAGQGQGQMVVDSKAY